MIIRIAEIQAHIQGNYMFDVQRSSSIFDRKNATCELHIYKVRSHINNLQQTRYYDRIRRKYQHIQTNDISIKELFCNTWIFQQYS